MGNQAQAKSETSTAAVSGRYHARPERNLKAGKDIDSSRVPPSRLPLEWPAILSLRNQNPSTPHYQFQLVQITDITIQSRHNGESSFSLFESKYKWRDAINDKGLVNVPNSNMVLQLSVAKENEVLSKSPWTLIIPRIFETSRCPNS